MGRGGGGGGWGGGGGVVLQNGKIAGLPVICVLF